MSVKAGDTVRVHYTGKLDSGEVFDSSAGRDPLEFTVGGGQVIPGFDEAVIGLAPGESRTVRIAAEDAYGERREDLVVALDRTLFEGEGLEEGLEVELEDEDGQTFVASVVRYDEKTVTVDLNHPLAGEALNFAIDLVSVAS